MARSKQEVENHKLLNINAIRGFSANLEIRRNIYQAEVYLRQVVAGVTDIDIVPPFLNDLEVNVFLTQSREEFGGRSIMASIRFLIDQEIKRGSFVASEQVPTPMPKSKEKLKTNTSLTPNYQEEQFVSMAELHRRYGLSFKALERILQGIKTRPGRVRSGVLYSLKEAAVVVARDREVPRADSTLGSVADGLGKTWTTVAGIREITGLSADTIKKYIQKVRFKYIKDKQGQTRRYYNQEGLLELLKPYTSAPKIGSQDRLVDAEGNDLTTAMDLSAKYGLSIVSIKKRLAGIATEGRNRLGFSIPLYPAQRAEQMLQRFLESPDIDPKTNVFQDKEGIIWITTGSLANKLGITVGQVYRFTESYHFPTKEARRGNHTLVLVKAALEKAISDYYALPAAGRDGRIANDSGTFIIPQQLQREGMQLEVNTMQRLLTSIEQVKGRSVNGKVSQYYLEDQAKKVLTDFLQLPRVNENGTYTQADGIEYVPRKYSEGEFPIYSEIGDAILSKCRAIFARDRAGRKIILYSLVDVQTSIASIPVIQIRK